MRISPPSPLGRALLALAIAVGLMAAGGGTGAQEKPAEPDIATLSEQWTRTLDRVKEQLQARDVTPAILDQLRGTIESVRASALTVQNEGQKRVEETKKLAAALGPPPKEGEPAESDEVRAKRADLAARQARDEGMVKQAGLVIARAAALLEQIAAARRERLARTLLTRGPSLFAPETWSKAGPEAVTMLARFATAPAEWWASELVGMRRGAGFFVLVPMIVIVAVAGGWLLRRWLLRRFGRLAKVGEPTYARRLLAATVEGVARGLIPALVTGAVYLTLWNGGLLVGLFGDMVVAATLAIILVDLATGLVLAALAPYSPAWRITPFEDDSSRLISRRLITLTWIFGLDVFVVESAAGLQTSEELGAIFLFFVDTAIAVVVLSLLHPRLWRLVAEPEEAAEAPKAPLRAVAPAPERRGRWWRRLRVLAFLAAVAIPVTALFGYHELSRFLATRLVVTAGILGLVYILHELVREVSRLLMDERYALGQRVRETFAISDRGAGMIQFWSLFFLDLLLVVAVAFALLPLWGVELEDLMAWARTLLTGVTIGEVTFSLRDFLLAVGFFLLLVMLVRIVQRFLEDKVLPQTRLDIGVRHSLRAAVGYIGVLAAALIAISTAGIDLSNLAIIAGALSVGIGFGLQNIVNNFVSGLILLVERPIKVGDWVVVGGHEGFVKRISVRATEIQTFQRASVIVPNSELLSTPLTNWTHKDLSGRVDLPIGVAYGSDTEKVRALMLGCAAAHPKVLERPAPAILFQGFGASSLDFELRIHIAFIPDRLEVASDLRFAIDKAFRDNGVEIPFSQHDIHLRDIGRLEAMFGGPGRPAAPMPPDPAPGA